MGLLLSLKRRARGPGLGTDPQVRRGRKPHPLAPRGEVRASRGEDKRCHFLGQRGSDGGGDADLGIHASPMVCTHSRTQKTFRTASPTSSRSLVTTLCTHHARVPSQEEPGLEEFPSKSESTQTRRCLPHSCPPANPATQPAGRVELPEPARTAVAGQRTEWLTNLGSGAWIGAEDTPQRPPPPQRRDSGPRGGAREGEGC